MKLLISLSLFSISVGAFAAAPVTDSSIESFFKEKTKIDNPMQLRDPFKAPFSKSGKKVEDNAGAAPKYTKTEKGEFRNFQEASLGETDIYNIKLVGVLIGKERRAMVKLKPEDKQVTIIREGTKLGPDNAEVKAILPGGIILIEKIVNVYGQEEYLETVIPISR
jgi:type IV pilus assembly protein PilP